MCSVAVGWRFSKRTFTVAASALLMLASACGGHFVSRGADLYDNGRYVEAAEVFERTEQRLAQSAADERARFGLYRGATFLKLGDAVHAAHWLGYARSIVSGEPGALDAAEHALLEASLKAVASIKQTPPAPGDTELATAPRP